jgi:hypothetical protein
MWSPARRTQRRVLLQEYSSPATTQSKTGFSANEKYF